jgi:cytochrome P450
MLEEILANFDVNDAELPARFYEVLEAARAQCPVFHSEASGYWVATRYTDVKAVLSDPATFSSSCPRRDDLSSSLIQVDPPMHREYRRLLDRMFSARHLEAHVPTLRTAMTAMVNRFVDRGSCELMADYAGPVSAASLAVAVFGLDFERYYDELLHVAEGVDEGAQTAGVDRHRARMPLNDLARRIIAERRACDPGPEDALGALLHGTVGGRPLTEDEIIANVILFIGAGLDTVKGALGGVVFRVACDPTLEARLRDPGWVRTDLDEFLRLDGPVATLPRYVTRDTVLGDQPLHAGDEVRVYFQSANRDDAVFPSADELDFEREQNRHLSFGAGIHRCLGSNLARLELALGVECLLERITKIRLQPGADIRYSTGTARHLVTLPITFDAR